MKKERYLLVCLGTRDGMYYYKDKQTGSRKSLETRDPEEAALLIQHKNLTAHAPQVNRQIGMAYLSGSDPALVERVWQDVMEDIIKDKTRPTLHRWKTAIKDSAFDQIRNQIVVTTQAADLKAVLRRGTISTNVYLRRLQNHCLDMGWLPTRILPKKQFPKIEHKEQWAVTWREHRRIVAREAARFGEHTDAPEADEISTDSPRTLKRLERVPALLMYGKHSEAKNRDTALYGYLRDIRICGQDVTFRFLQEGTFTRKVVVEFGDRLGIDDWEYNRTHWAIKHGGIPSAMMVKLTRTYDVFISHAGENKDSFVRPLAAALADLGLRVWYDECTLTIGDRLRAKIDEGLASCRYGVVVLSDAFFAKEWPKAELEGFFSREMEGGKVILPVWHRVTKADVAKFSPMLLGKLAVISDKGVPAVAEAICSVICPSALPVTNCKPPTNAAVNRRRKTAGQPIRLV